MTTTSKIFTDNMGGTDAASYIGVKGEMFFDLDVGLLRLSDGETVGGIPQTIAAATAATLGSVQPGPEFNMDGSIMNLLPGTENRIGGIKVGPGVNISSDGTITASGTLAVDATATPTANKIVARDANAMIAATTYKGGTRNAGSFGADSTLTIDFATDNYVLATITGETVTVAYTNIVLGKKVVVMFKNASGTDLDVDSGVSDINSTGGFGTGSIKNNATGQLIVTSFGTTTADLYTDFRI